MSDVWDPETDVEENRHNWSGEPQHRQPLADEPSDTDAPNVVDLFCGPGGISQGLEQAGFETVLGVDIHEPSIETFQRNHPHAHAIVGDIRRINKRDGDTRDIFEVIDDDEVTDDTLLEDVAAEALGGEELSVLTAGIPCQGFSIANRKQNDEDERNYLFEEFIRAARILDPTFVLIENVSTMTAANDGAFVDAVVECLERLGYRVDYRVLNAADFGVPQRRERLFFLGAKDDHPLVWPEPTHENDHRPVSEAISDLPPVGPGESASEYPDRASCSTYERLMRDIDVGGDDGEGVANHQAPNHQQSTVERVEGTEPGEPMYDRFRQRIRLHPDDPGPTIIAGGIRPQFQYGHYEQGRGLTVRERARIQSFPDGYVFEGGTVQGRVQTGMAVPPLLGQRLGEAIQRSRDAKPFVEAVTDWSRANAREFPWRADDTTPYEGLLAAVLLHENDAETVRPVYEAFVEEYPDLNALGSADSEALAEVLEPLANPAGTAKTLRDITSQLVFAGVPKTRAELLELPHVDSRIADATLCYGYGEPSPVVDAAVARVCARVFDIDVDDDTPHEDEYLLDFVASLVPDEDPRAFTFGLLDLAAELQAPEHSVLESDSVEELCAYIEND